MIHGLHHRPALSDLSSEDLGLRALLAQCSCVVHEQRARFCALLRATNEG